MTTSREAAAAVVAPFGLWDAWNGACPIVWPSHFTSIAGASPPPLSQVSKLTVSPCGRPSSMAWLRSGVDGAVAAGTSLKLKPSAGLAPPLQQVEPKREALKVAVNELTFAPPLKSLM